MLLLLLPVEGGKRIPVPAVPLWLWLVNATVVDVHVIMYAIVLTLCPMVKALCLLFYNVMCNLWTCFYSNVGRTWFVYQLCERDVIMMMML